MQAALIFPHQLYAASPVLDKADAIYLVEDPLFFRQYDFHRSKLVLHRASMKAFAAMLSDDGKKVRYIDSDKLKKTGDLVAILKKAKVTSAVMLEPNDDWLHRRLSAACQKHKIDSEVIDDPFFLTSHKQIDDFAAGKDSLHFTSFYIQQRKRLKLLLNSDGGPVGGKWSFDPENRKKLPKKILIPEVPKPSDNKYVTEAKTYVAKKFPNALGSVDNFNYAIDRTGALKLLQDFVVHRFENFGDYEDAISTQHRVMFHSQLTPYLNTGLLTPRDVLAAIEERPAGVGINSLEGFVRQVIGWREYMRAVYSLYGGSQRTKNFWSLDRKLPKSFYDGTTGIEPFDHSINNALETGYCHHIERLMILGNFMLLCRIDPNEVYRWFMELFVDAYDWVMVPNVYAMSQYSDGGKITTKPYISGSAYVRRMSDFPKGDWCDVWDGLYWTFVDDYRGVFENNNRMSLMPKQLDRMGDKLKLHRKNAKQFLDSLK